MRRRGGLQCSMSAAAVIHSSDTSLASVPVTAEMEAWVGSLSPSPPPPPPQCLLETVRRELDPCFTTLCQVKNFYVQQRLLWLLLSEEWAGPLPTHAVLCWMLWMSMSVTYTVARVTYALVKYTAIGGINNLWLVQCVWHVHSLVNVWYHVCPDNVKVFKFTPHTVVRSSLYISLLQ